VKINWLNDFQSLPVLSHHFWYFIALLKILLPVLLLLFYPQQICCYYHRSLICVLQKSCCGSSSYRDWHASGWFKTSTNHSALIVPDSCCKSPVLACGTRPNPNNIFQKVTTTILLSFIFSLIVNLFSTSVSRNLEMFSLHWYHDNRGVCSKCLNAAFGTVRIKDRIRKTVPRVRNRPAWQKPVAVHAKSVPDIVHGVGCNPYVFPDSQLALNSRLLLKRRPWILKHWKKNFLIVFDNEKKALRSLECSCTCNQSNVWCKRIKSLRQPSLVTYCHVVQTTFLFQ